MPKKQTAWYDDLLMAASRRGNDLVGAAADLADRYGLTPADAAAWIAQNVEGRSPQEVARIRRNLRPLGSNRAVVEAGVRSNEERFRRQGGKGARSAEQVQMPVRLAALGRNPLAVPRAVAAVAPELARSAARYVRDTPVSEMTSDVGDLAASAYRAAKEDPYGLGFDAALYANPVIAAASAVPDTARMREASASLDPYAATDPEAARAQQMIDAAAILPGLGVLPSAGLLRRGRREVRALPEAAAPTRPVYSVREEGPVLSVSRVGLEPTADPAMATGNMADLRARMADPANNPALRIAQEEALARGAPLDLENLPQTSLQRQGGIARMFDAAAEGSDEYKRALFERYGAEMPQVVEEAGAQNYDQLTEAAYRKLLGEVTHQFDRLPVSMQYHYGDLEYPTPSAMFRDALGRGNLNVYRGGDPHPFLSDVDPTTQLTGNEMFRAVHDYLGHVPAGSTFRPGGEEVAYATHAQTLSPLAQMALLSETRGQNSWVNYGGANAALRGEMDTLRRQLREIEMAQTGPGLRPDEREKLLAQMPDPDALRAKLRELGSQTVYAPQQPLLLPPEYLAVDSAGGIPEWSKSLIVPRAPVEARGQHYSTTEGLTQLDPAFYGTGHRGQDYAPTQRRGGPSRTHFYVSPTGRRISPEPGVERVAPYRYEADLSGLYDLDADPENLVKIARVDAGRNAATGESYEPLTPFWMHQDKGIESTSAIPAFERLVREYGYPGYLSDFGSNRAAVVFDPTDVVSAP